MNAWKIVGHVLRLLSVVVIAASGWYLIVYLYRWEWNRALISGLFFVAAIVTFTTSLILAALRHVNERLDRLEGILASSRSAASGAIAAPVAADGAGSQPGARPRGARQFDWLREPVDGFGVFVPVLIGAGVVLSGVAYIIERVAALLTGAHVDRRTTRLLEPDLALSATPTLLPAVEVRRSRERSGIARGLAWTVALAVVVLVAVAAVNLIAEATQSRDEVLDPTIETTVDVHIRQKRVQRPDETVAAALWTACSGRLPPQVQLLSIDDLGDDVVRLHFDRELGDLSRRRLFGCLEDGTLDFVTANVTGFELHG